MVVSEHVRRPKVYLLIRGPSEVRSEDDAQIIGIHQIDLGVCSNLRQELNHGLQQKVVLGRQFSHEVPNPGGLLVVLHV